MRHLHIDIALRLEQFNLSVNEEIPMSGITGLFGASGSGKTTLLRIIAGLETRATGQLKLDDTHWQSGGHVLPAHRRRAGYVFQQGALFSHMTVAGNLRFAERFRPAGSAGISARVVEAFGLEDLMSRRPATLSGGERQRVALARSLIADPVLLLLDEPVSALDSARRRRIVEIIAELPERFGLPVIYVTHDANELARVADRALLISNGQITARGDVQHVLHHNDFSGAQNSANPGSILACRVIEHTSEMSVLDVSGQTIRIPRARADTGKTVWIRVPARDVVLALSRPDGISIRNALSARIESITACSPGQTDVALDLKGQTLIARITREAAAELKLSTGQAVFALIKSVAIDDGLGPIET